MDKMFVILASDKNETGTHSLYVCKEEETAKKMIEERKDNDKGLIYWYEESRLI